MTGTWTNSGFLHVKSFNTLRNAHRQTAHYLKENPSLDADVRQSIAAFRGLPSVSPGGCILLALFQAPEAPRWGLITKLAYEEVEQSYWMADIGLYRHACAALRAALELVVVAAHFSRAEISDEKLERWFVRCENPGKFRRELLEPLMSLPRLQRADAILSIRKGVQSLYDGLCKYVHTRGYFHSSYGLSHLGDPCSPGLALSASSLSDYASLLHNVARVATILLLARYPMAMQDVPMFEKFPWESIPQGLLTAEERADILKAVSPKDAGSLKTLSDADPGVRWMTHQIRSLPDWAPLHEQAARAGRMLRVRPRIINHGGTAFPVWPYDDVPGGFSLSEQLENSRKFIEWFAECDRRGNRGR